jgi:hypothetical protein
VRELASRQTEAAIRTLTDIMLDDEAENRDRIVAANALLDRAHGRPAQAITGEDGKPLQIDASAGLLELFEGLAKRQQLEPRDVTPVLPPKVNE